MRIKTPLLSITLAGCLLALAACSEQEQQTSTQPEPVVSDAPDISVDQDDIGGVVTSSNGPEAGVWVIAETDDLPTLYSKTVVTDENGRYLMPDLPAAQYDIWVRGYGLVDSEKVNAAPGQSLDLNAVIEDATLDLEARIQEVAGQIEVGDMPVIDADTTQMRQLFMNLIGNSLKYHHKDRPPVVKINCRRDYGALPGALASRSVDGYCEITVSDNGIGFDEKYADRIFEIFQRLHGRSSYDGTGIGLALCRRIVERHGGTISATSKPGDGATFHVKLPITQLFPELANGSR